MGSQSSKTKQDDFEEINIEFNVDTDSSENSLSDIFTKLEDKVNEQEKEQDNMQEQTASDNTSPFISTELYNKIMNNESENVDSSPFIKTDEYKQILNEEMTGGNENLRMKKGKLIDSDEDMPDDDLNNDDISDSDSSDSSDLLAELSNITLSSSDYSVSNKNTQKTKFKEEKGKYGYSKTQKDPFGLGKRPIKKQGKQNFKKTSNKKQGKQNLKKTSKKQNKNVAEYETSQKLLTYQILKKIIILIIHQKTLTPHTRSSHLK